MLDIPETAEEVQQRAKTDVRRALPESNPFLKNSGISALTVGYANRVFDFYLQLKEAIKQSFPDTSTSTFLERWSAIFGLTRLAATKSNGNVVSTGIDTTIIPINTPYVSSDGIVYKSQGAVAITATQLSVTSITRVGQTATVTTLSNHALANNVSCTISGAVQSEYNGVVDINITGLNTFTYTVTGSPVTPATGTIFVDHTSIPVPLISEEFQNSSTGVNVNQDSGAILSLQSPIAGVDSEAGVDFGSIGGGVDQETDSDLLIRLLDRIQNPVANFNVSAISSQAKTINGVTRVFVDEAGSITGTQTVTSITRSGNVATVTTPSPHGAESGNVVTITDAVQTDYNVIEATILVESTTVFHYIVPNAPVTPATGTITATTNLDLGQVQIFFMRDNDSNPIPTAGEVTTVKNKILEIKPANTIDADVIVSAPTAVPTTYTFSSLSPNTPAMQTAIDANLQQFYAEETTVGSIITEEKYIAAIQNTIDEDGITINSFALTSPTADIAIDAGEIGTLGGTIYP